jgi:hypothetical protein
MCKHLHTYYKFSNWCNRIFITKKSNRPPSFLWNSFEKGVKKLQLWRHQKDKHKWNGMNWKKLPSEKQTKVWMWTEWEKSRNDTKTFIFIFITYLHKALDYTCGDRGSKLKKAREVCKLREERNYIHNRRSLERSNRKKRNI